MNEPTSPATYLWIDIETTGLGPAADPILEVGIVATDEHLVQIGAACSWVCRRPRWDALRLMQPNVVEMHTKNGLLDELESAPYNTDQVEECVMAFCAEIFGEKQPILAGSTIRFDAAFIKEQMPKLAARLHYRQFDVRPLQMAAETVWGWKMPKAEAHRALADVQESLGYARKIYEEMGRKASYEHSIRLALSHLVDESLPEAERIQRASLALHFGPHTVGVP